MVENILLFLALVLMNTLGFLLVDKAYGHAKVNPWIRVLGMIVVSFAGMCCVYWF